MPDLYPFTPNFGMFNFDLYKPWFKTMIYFVQNFTKSTSRRFRRTRPSTCWRRLSYFRTRQTTKPRINQIHKVGRSSCRNFSNSEVFLKPGPNRFYISPSCRLQLADHLIISDVSLKLDNVIKHYEWELDKIAFTEEEEDRSTEWLTILNDENATIASRFMDLFVRAEFLANVTARTAKN